MPSFNSISGQQTNEYVIPEQYSTPEKKTNLLSKVFLVMFISLLATAGLSYGIAALLVSFINTGNDAGVDVLYGLMIVSSIGLMVMAFVMPVILNKGKHSILPAYIIYMLFMSVLLSSVFIAYDLSILLITFVVTAGIFGIMGLLGIVSKGSISALSSTISGLLIGIIVLTIVNIFMGSDLLYLGVSFGILALFLFVTIYDVRRINQLISSGYGNSYNLILYCSFILYVDFINIFLRILYYVAALKDKN